MSKPKPTPKTNPKPKSKSKSGKADDSRIAENRRARYEYAIEETYEAGLVLEGWEVKSLRAGKGGIADSYVIIKNGEAWLLGAQITPLLSASTHIHPEAGRTRKLLLNKRELNKLQGATERKGFTVIPLKMYWKNNRIKISIAIAQGKKLVDKRQSVKERDVQRSLQRFKKL